MSLSTTPHITGSALLVHIPRTAGNSIHAVTGCYCDHRPAAVIREMFPDWDKAWKFALVRNPWDHCVSWWSFNRDRGITSKPFRAWVRDNDNFWKDNPRWHWGDPIDSWSYITENDNVIVDHVGQFEDLPNQWKIISEKMGISAVLPHVVVSQHSLYQDYYDKETECIVGDRYSEIINHVGYSF